MVYLVSPLSNDDREITSLIILLQSLNFVQSSASTYKAALHEAVLVNWCIEYWFFVYTVPTYYILSISVLIIVRA